MECPQRDNSSDDSGSSDSSDVSSSSSGEKLAHSEVYKVSLTGLTNEYPVFLAAAYNRLPGS